MSQRVTLDDTDMRARLRSHGHAGAPAGYVSRPAVRPSRQLLQDVGTPAGQRRQAVQATHNPVPIPKPPTAPVSPAVTMQVVEKAQLQTPAVLVKTNAYVQPAAKSRAVHTELQPSIGRHPQPSKVLVRKAFFLKPDEPNEAHNEQSSNRRFKLSKPSKSTMLTAMAVIVFVVGLGASLTGFRTNNIVQAQVTKINKKVATGAATTTASTDGAPPSTTPVSSKAVAAYQVAPDLARYIRIPKIGVYARVLSVGTTKDGALATPTNVFDSAWYNASAKPGQPGATLIDGHVSSWTSHGVFYDIKKLVAGDTIQIQKGDGSLVNYTVVRTALYDADKVDMQALITPVNGGSTSGLNLITCGGKYDSKSNEFTQRVAVFATQS